MTLWAFLSVGDSQALRLVLRQSSVGADMLRIYIAMRTEDVREWSEAIMGINLRTLIVLAIILAIIFALSRAAKYRNWKK